MEITIETIVCCFKNNGLLSFPVPLKFFSSRKPDAVNLGSVLLRIFLAGERGEERKGEEEEELSSHISIILYPDKKNSINFPLISKEKLGDISSYEEI